MEATQIDEEEEAKDHRKMTDSAERHETAHVKWRAERITARYKRNASFRCKLASGRGPCGGTRVAAVRHLEGFERV
jgi:hypothetical protein